MKSSHANGVLENTPLLLLIVMDTLAKYCEDPMAKYCEDPMAKYCEDPMKIEGAVSIRIFRMRAHTLSKNEMATEWRVFMQMKS